MTKNPLPTNLIKHMSRNPVQRFLINNFFSELITLVKKLRVDSILDAGCGEGFTLNRLLTNGVKVKKIEGVEYSEEVIGLSKILFPDLKIKNGSLYKLPYKNNSFDLVICTEVLEHLGAPTKALREILRVSKKYVILSVPNEPFFRISNFLRGKNLSRFGNDQEHINHWGYWSFTKFLKENCVKIQIIKLPFPWLLILGVR
jgi:SAM-dependent methyltransferase